jgi:hypothetical protein
VGSQRLGLEPSAFVAILQTWVEFVAGAGGAWIAAAPHLADGCVRRLPRIADFGEDRAMQSFRLGLPVFTALVVLLASPAAGSAAAAPGVGAVQLPDRVVEPESAVADELQRDTRSRNATTHHRA